MNITIVQPRISYYSGGGEKYPMESILYLAEHNTNVTFSVYTTRQEGKESAMYLNFKRQIGNFKNIILFELNVPEEFKYIYNIPPGESRYRWDIESYFFSNLVLDEVISNQAKPDIVWVYYLLDFPFKIKDVKTVLNLLGYPRVKSEYREAFLSQYDSFVPINKNIINKWNDLLEIKIDNFTCLPLGINTRENLTEIGIQVDKKCFNILFAGRLIERKGILDLCEVVKKLNNQNYKVKLYILGEGPLFEQIKKFTEKYNLLDVINLLGQKENISNYYKFADACVFPSHEGEGQMSSVLEAMYFNGNVISTYNNGNEDYIVNKESGFLFNSGNLPELEKILMEQINKVSDIEKIKINAKKSVEDINWLNFNEIFIKICTDLKNTKKMA